MCGGFLMILIRNACLCVGYPIKIFVVYNYATFPFDMCT